MTERERIEKFKDELSTLVKKYGITLKAQIDAEIQGDIMITRASQIVVMPLTGFVSQEIPDPQIKD